MPQLPELVGERRTPNGGGVVSGGGITPKQDATSHLRRHARTTLAEAVRELYSIELYSDADHIKAVAKYLEMAATWLESQPDA